MINQIIKSMFQAYKEVKEPERKQKRYDELFYGNYACSPEYLSNLYNDADTDEQEDMVIEYLNLTRSYEFDGYKNIYNKHVNKRR